MSRSRSNAPGQQCLDFEVKADPLKEHHRITTPAGATSVTVADVLEQLDAALAICARADALPQRIAAVMEHGDHRQRAYRRTKWERTVIHAGYMTLTGRMLARYRELLTDAGSDVGILADAVTTLGALHGQPGYDDASPIPPPGFQADGDRPSHGDLASTVDLIDAVEEFLDDVALAVPLVEDIASVRRQLAVYRGLRPGDWVNFVDDDAWAGMSLEQRRRHGTGYFQPAPYRVHLLPRPAQVLMARGTQPVARPEVLTWRQIDALVAAVARGLSPAATLESLPGAAGRLTQADLVTSLTRYGVWLAQSPMADVDIRRAHGERHRPALYQQLLSEVRPDGLTLVNPNGVMSIDPQWGQPALGGADPARVAVALHRAPAARWYCIVRGDVTDLMSLVPLRQASVSAMAAALADGQSLSASAAWSGRPLRVQLHAYDRAVSFARREADVYHQLQRIRTLLMAAKPADVDKLVAAAITLLRQSDIDESALTQELDDHRQVRRRSATAEQAVRTSLAALIGDAAAELLAAPLEPADWPRSLWDRFFASQPDLAPRSDRAATVGSDLIADIRALAAAAHHQPAAPAYLVEVYADLHDCLAEALRRARPPRWPAHILQVREINGTPTGRRARLLLRRAIAAAFADRPLLVTQVEKSSTLLRPLYE